jgi:hypothetical protein
MFSKAVKTAMVGAAAVIALGGATMSATTASADPWHGGGYHGGGYGGYHEGYRGGYRGGYGPGVAIGAGILGVAIGESLSHPYYGRAPGYYAGPGYWGYNDGCRSYYRWDPRWGRYVRVERCY